MKIYVVETCYDYVVQVGFSYSETIARRKAMELSDKLNRQYWVTEYTCGKDKFCYFEEIER